MSDASWQHARRICGDCFDGEAIQVSDCPKRRQFIQAAIMLMLGAALIWMVRTVAELPISDPRLVGILLVYSSIAALGLFSRYRRLPYQPQRIIVSSKWIEFRFPSSEERHLLEDVVVAEGQDGAEPICLIIGDRRLFVMPSMPGFSDLIELLRRGRAEFRYEHLAGPDSERPRPD